MTRLIFEKWQKLPFYNGKIVKIGVFRSETSNSQKHTKNEIRSMYGDWPMQKQLEETPYTQAMTRFWKVAKEAILQT